MRQCLSGVVAVLGVWLVIAPWILHTGIGFGQIASIVAGVIFLVLGIVGAKRKEAYFGGGDWAALVIAVIAFVIGIVAFSADPCTRASMIVCGLLVATVSWLGLHLPKKPRPTKVRSQTGQELVEFKKMVADDKGIGGKVILMGAMRQTVYFQPGELFVLLSQVTPDVVAAVLKELFLTPPGIADPKDPKEDKKK